MRLTHERQECDFYRTPNYPEFRLSIFGSSGTHLCGEMLSCPAPQICKHGCNTTVLSQKSNASLQVLCFWFARVWGGGNSHAREKVCHKPNVAVHFLFTRRNNIKAACHQIQVLSIFLLFPFRVTHLSGSAPAIHHPLSTSPTPVDLTTPWQMSGTHTSPTQRFHTWRDGERWRLPEAALWWNCERLWACGRSPKCTLCFLVEDLGTSSLLCFANDALCLFLGFPVSKVGSPSSFATQQHIWGCRIRSTSKMPIAFPGGGSGSHSVLFGFDHAFCVFHEFPVMPKLWVSPSSFACLFCALFLARNGFRRMILVRTSAACKPLWKSLCFFFLNRIRVVLCRRDWKFTESTVICGQLCGWASRDRQVSSHCTTAPVHS